MEGDLDRFSLRDFCGAARDESYFTVHSLPQVLRLLKRNERGVNSVHVLLILIFVLWLLATGVPGFNLYNGGALSMSAYTHSMWWLVVQFFVLLVGQSALKFGLHYAESNHVVEKGVGGSLVRMFYYQFLLGIGAVAHVLHAVFMGLELGTCSSTLCVSYKWVFWSAFVALWIMPVLHLWQIYRVQVYKVNFNAAIKYGKVDFSIMTVPDDDEETARIPAAKEQNSTLPPSGRMLIEPSGRAISPAIQAYRSKRAQRVGPPYTHKNK